MNDRTSQLVDRLATPAETGLDSAYLVPLLRLLATGDPVDVASLAAAAGRSIQDTGSALARVPDTEYHDQGRIVGQGLTLRPFGLLLVNADGLGLSERLTALRSHER